MPRAPVLLAALTCWSPVTAVLLSLISARSLPGEAADSGQRPGAGCPAQAAVRSADTPDAIPRRSRWPPCQPPGWSEADRHPAVVPSSHRSAATRLTLRLCALSADSSHMSKTGRVSGACVARAPETQTGHWLD